MPTLIDRSHGGNANFNIITRTFLEDLGLPAESMLPAKEIEDVFRRHDALFGQTYNTIYDTAITLWAFLSQCLSDGKSRSCSAAVERIASYCGSNGKRSPSTDTGAFCVAREKLSEDALHELVATTGRKTESLIEDDWRWCDRTVKLVDGFTATMADTPKNQAEYPQPSSQKPGVGFPMIRALVVVSLATACICDAAFGPYSGKKTGELALLRQVLHAFESGDVALFDRGCCSYMMLADFMLQNVDVCARLHHDRPHDMRRGQRLGKDDILVTWLRPARPEWMDKETYATIPETITLRQIRYKIEVPGFRTREVTVVTTLLDPEEYSAEEIAELYDARWNVELDIRDVKQTLNMDEMRCKTPAMVRKELWTTLLAYNLIRRTICFASCRHEKIPRRISFTRTCVLLLNFTTLHSPIEHVVDRIDRLLKRISRLKIPSRPGRIEPRKLKRRPSNYHYLQNSRKIEKQQLLHATSCDKLT